MRIIKFRTWDNVDYMSKPFDLKDIQFNAIQFTDNVKIMQFTGLYDVNGKEIYEGDIIKHRYFSIKGIAEVRWSDEEACFLAIEPNGARVILRPNSEIIGNIWENPELLNES